MGLFYSGGTSHQELQSNAQSESTRKFEWGRALIAVVLLVLILVSGLFAEGHGLETWSASLHHSFEILFGVFVGLISGESINNK